ncbi:hypothetical protein L798_02770 [Zootermopsis nevadensis]|uniref:Uncharacterized protein n=1 Tax=Zootermopsis nevadensis TaxID=136037 RepID=A0A067RFC1_ZOONE|nr:hypothetical protein L798_02770 [Zootermopsis nevadensis]
MGVAKAVTNMYTSKSTYQNLLNTITTPRPFIFTSAGMEAVMDIMGTVMVMATSTTSVTGMATITVTGMATITVTDMSTITVMATATTMVMDTATILAMAIITVMNMAMGMGATIRTKFNM